MNWKPCTKSPDGRHNFVITGGDCANGCGMNQTELSGKVKKVVSNPFENPLLRIQKQAAENKKNRIHSELHELIYKMIQQFHEPKKITVGGRSVATFGYYLGRLKKVPISTIYQWLSEIRQSDNIRNEGKIFWWKYRHWLKEKKEPPHPP